MENGRIEKRPIQPEGASVEDGSIQASDAKRQRTDSAPVTTTTATSAFLKATNDLIAEGGVPINDNVLQLREIIRHENEDIKMGTSTNLVAITESDDEVDAQLQRPSPQKPEAESIDLASLDGTPLPQSTPSEVEERITRPSSYLFRFWADNVSKHHPPKFELVQSSVDQKYGCTLHLHFPPAATRTFTVPVNFATKKDAKDAISKMAMQYHVCEDAQAARVEAGPEPPKTITPALSTLSTIAGPVGLLTQAYQRFMPVGELSYDFISDDLNNTHGVTLTIPITDTDIRVFAVDPKFSTRRAAKESVAREALRAGVPALMEAAFKERLVADTGGFISFEAGSKEPVVDAIAVLNREAKSNLAAGTKALAYTTTTLPVEEKAGASEGVNGSSLPDSAPLAPSSQPPQYGATLIVEIDSNTKRIFVTPSTHRSKGYARHAVSALALKEGIVEEMRKAKEEGRRPTDREEGKANPKDSKERPPVEKKILGPVPAPGTVPESEYDTMDQTVSYLNACFQTWTKSSSPLTFEYEVDSTTHKVGATLTVQAPPLNGRQFTTETEHATKKLAKEAVCRLALTEKVLELIRPKDDQVVPGRPLGKTRGNPALNGAAATRGALARAGGRGMPMRGGLRDGGYGRQQPQQPFYPGSGPGFSQQGNNGWLLPPPPPHEYQRRDPYFQTDPRGFAPAFPPVLNGGVGGGPYGNAPARGSSQPVEMVQYLDQFCQEWMGPGHLPNYDVRQHVQTGLFGAVIRLPLSPINIKSFWVDQDFHTRGEAQEAVARIAIQDGIIDAVKREFVRNSAFPPPGPPIPSPYGFQPQQPPRQAPPPPQFNNRSSPFLNQGPPLLPPNQGGFVSFQQSLDQRHPQQYPPPGPPNFGNQNQFQPALPPRPREINPLPRQASTAPKPGPKPPKNAIAATKKSDGLAPNVKDDDASTTTSTSTKSNNWPVGDLNNAIQAVLGPSWSAGDKKPAYAVTKDAAASKFGCVLTVLAAPDHPLVYTVSTTYNTARDAKIAVATLATEQGIINKIQGLVASQPAVPQASTSSVLPTQAPIPPPQAPPIPTSSIPATTTTTPARPNSEQSKAKRGGNSVASLEGAFASLLLIFSDIDPESSLALSQIEYCQSAGLGQPEFNSEMKSTVENGSTKEVLSRLWVVVGDLKFELPNPAAKGGQEKLASRVLKHLLEQATTKPQ